MRDLFSGVYFERREDLTDGDDDATRQPSDQGDGGFC